MNTFNSNQQKFIDSESNFILSVSVAGSGKTTSVIEKIYKLSENRIHPRNVLCITFTRAAGINIKERATLKIGEEANEMFSGTFHAFAIKVITENAKHVSPIWEDHEITCGKLNFTIYDQEDRRAICAKLIKKLNVKVSVSDIEKYIYKELDEPKNLHDIELIAKEYQQFCIENIALDLDDLLNVATNLLKNESVRQNYLYEYVFVDEYNDTNDTQNAFIKALQPKRLIVIGDDSQSIYAFNRAKIEYILNFENEWPEVEIITLEDNYRSTHQIVDKAKQIVDLNFQGMKKNIVAHKSGERIEFYTGASIDEEFEYVRQQIEKRGGPLSEHTILCRTNALAINASDYLKMKGVPVNLVSNVNDPFKKDHVKRVMKFIQFALNPMDSFAYEQSINFPIHRVSDYQVHQAINDAFINEKPITDYSDKHFAIMCKQLAKSFDKDANETFIQALNLLEIVQEYVMKGLTNRIKDFDDVDKEITRWKKKSRDKSIKSFMRWLCIKDIQEKTIEKVEAVNIMTCHASKGLEWDHVYICGVTSGIFPSEKASQDIEEERRLMHVAITRAKETVDITSAEYYRTPYGQIFTAGPSEFYKMLEG